MCLNEIYSKGLNGKHLFNILLIQSEARRSFINIALEYAIKKAQENQQLDVSASAHPDINLGGGGGITQTPYIKTHKNSNKSW
jgi:hypothetical protein